MVTGMRAGPRDNWLAEKLNKKSNAIFRYRRARKGYLKIASQSKRKYPRRNIGNCLDNIKRYLLMKKFEIFMKPHFIYLTPFVVIVIR